MDIFKFNNPHEETLMEQGEIINGLTSKLWIERYRDAGEFTITAPASSELTYKLPLGTFISHTNTQEVMIVENHEINESLTQEAIITVSGRSFETILEQRIVGSNFTPPYQAAVVDINLPVQAIQLQVVNLINTYIRTDLLVRPDDAIPHVVALTDITSGGTSALRTVKRDTVYNIAKTLLAVDNLGIKSLRYGPGSLYDKTWTELIVHNGKNLAPGVIFSAAEGDIEQADYLWSNKKAKNAALVSSKWGQQLVFNWPFTATGYDRRMMFVDGSDIDQQYTTQPTGATMTAILQSLTIRGQGAIQTQNQTVVVNPKSVNKVSVPVYRKDYNVGDIVQIAGGYRQSAQMRVSEFAEIEDDHGETGYPTFTVPGDLNV